MKIHKIILEMLAMDLDAITFWIKEDKITKAEGTIVQTEESKHEIFNTPFEISIE